MRALDSSQTAAKGAVITGLRVAAAELQTEKEREDEHCVECVSCSASTAVLHAAASARVRSNVRAFGAETFTVWRCAKCESLHAKAPIDYVVYYLDYPLNRINYGFLTKLVQRKLMWILKRAGLKSGKTLLDYGCGCGHFVRYARAQGVRTEGYDAEHLDDLRARKGPEELCSPGRLYGYQHYQCRYT
jgi:hypothetical protein